MYKADTFWNMFHNLIVQRRTDGLRSAALELEITYKLPFLCLRLSFRFVKACFFRRRHFYRHNSWD